MKTISMVSSEVWKEVFIDVNKAVVFIDNACAEVLHWNGGLSALTEAGAVDVKEFSSFESAQSHQKKAVFITSSCLEEVITREIIQDIIQASHFQYVIIITAVTPRMHLFKKSGSYDGDTHSIFDAFEEDLLEWMENMNYTAEIKHIPVLMSCISNNVFITPAFTELFPLIETDVKQLRIQHASKKTEKKHLECLNDLDMTCLPADLQIWFKTFVSSIDSLLSELAVSEDCYSIGPTSRILATELANYAPAKTRRKSTQNKASIVFVDRTLDIGSSCTHQTETLFDRIASVFPRLPGHNNDVLIDMSSLCHVHKDASSTVLPGCLASFNGHNQQHLQPLLTNKVKEGLMEVNRQLVDIASKENLPLKLTGKPGRVTADQLENTLSLFKGKYDMILKHINTLQVSMAVFQLLKSQRQQQLDSLSGIEKLLIQGYSDETDPLEEIYRLIITETEKSTTERSCTLDDIFCLIMFVYSVYGTRIKSDKEEQVKAVLVKYVLREKNTLPPLTQQIVGDTINEEVVTAILDDAWQKFKAISSARNNLKQFSSVCEESALGPSQLMPILKQLINVMFDPSKPELPDVELKSSGFGDLLKSGFGLFRTVSKPRPSDHPLLIIFVVGGVTSTELKQIKDLCASLKLSSQVIVGSTRLIKPEDIVTSILCQDRINRV
ncbi:sec1 family domain-containing protein 2-like isoform X2 [Mytilus galloprovincialis]